MRDFTNDIGRLLNDERATAEPKSTPEGVLAGVALVGANKASARWIAERAG